VWAKFVGLVGLGGTLVHRFLMTNSSSRSCDEDDERRRVGSYQACCIIPAALPASAMTILTVVAQSQRILHDMRPH